MNRMLTRWPPGPSARWMLWASRRPRPVPEMRGPAVPSDLAAALQAPAYATYAEEGRVGGISLIVTLYPR